MVRLKGRVFFNMGENYFLYGNGPKGRQVVPVRQGRYVQGETVKNLI